MPSLSPERRREIEGKLTRHLIDDTGDAEEGERG